ncbi:hypothetical protein GCM10029978_020330 [Actinoallomurus acanthiterrae]
MRPPGWFRLLRAGVFAAVCVVLSLAGHDLMASRPAPAWAGWAALAGLTAVGYCLADRRRPAWWILLAVEVAQACLHLWFTWCTSPDPGTAPGRPAMTMHGGVHHVVNTGTASQGGGAYGLGMTGAHALAGVLVALWLYAGERALWRALGVAAEALLDPALRVFALLVLADAVVDRRPRGTADRRGADEARPIVAALRHVLVRRGPPRDSGLLTFM